MEHGEHAAEVLRVYPAWTDEQPEQSVQALASDRFIACGTWKWIEMQLKTGGSSVFGYRFEDAPPIKSGTASRGAYHSAEIEFVFEQLKSKDLQWRPEDFKLSDLISSYWTNFAKTGDPNGPGLPQWPRYDKQDGYQVMHLSAASHAAPAEDRARYQVLDSVRGRD
ncbi:MAG: carboxylesterase family protein [Acidobacteriaceae bacterium]|nr:carboxylesterase family protein [Acidobacteriaceae bacterium]